MKDSARTKQDDSATPAERPTWRFTGRRGTPVHLREQAPQTLPPEIRKAVTQLARERAGESATSPDSKPVRAVPDLKLSRPEGQVPPVAGAPMPVERRSRRDTSEPVVATSHIPAATAPIAEPTFEAAPELPVVAMEPPSIESAVEVAAETPVEVADDPVVETTPSAAVDTPELTPTARAVAQAIADATPEDATEDAAASETSPAATAHATANADDEQVDAKAADTKAADAKTADATAADAPSAKRHKLTAAERKKLAKARAKAKAKAERAAKKDADGAAAADKARRLFARGRDVDAAAAAKVEPDVEPVPVADAPTVEATAADTPAVEQPVLETPAAETPAIETPFTEAPAADAGPLEFPSPDTLSVDSPLPPDVADLPDLLPSLDSIDDAATPSRPALEPAAWNDVDVDVDQELELAVPTSIAHVDLGAAVADDASPADLIDLALLDPALATESAAQAAWELGRLPFLLTDPSPAAVEPDMEQHAAIWDVTPSTVSLPIRTDETIEPAAATIEPSVERVEEPVPLRSTLQPIDWLPVGAQPTPAPIEPIDMPRRTAPDAIQRLTAPLEVPRPEQSLARAGAREGMTANSRTAEARRRIARRRAELDDLVETLAGLGSGRRDG